MKILKHVAFSTVAAATVALATPASAATIVVGNGSPQGTGDCTPGCTPTIQTVYGSSLFGSAPITINSFGVFLSSVGANASTVITLATSANRVGSLSSTFADNLTQDAFVLFSGMFPSVKDSDGFTIFSGNGFTYDPTKGDLLVQIKSASSFGAGSSYSYNLNAQRVFSFGVNAANGSREGPGYAFNTKFDVSPATAAVPEPATWAMMILGMGAVGFAMRRRKRNVTTTVAYAA